MAKSVGSLFVEFICDAGRYYTDSWVRQLITHLETIANGRPVQDPFLDLDIIIGRPVTAEDARQGAKMLRSELLRREKERRLAIETGTDIDWSADDD